MKVLVDIGHPAHVHLNKELIKNLKRDGHKVIITTKDIAIVKHLMDIEGFDYITLGKKGRNFLSKAIKQLVFDFKVWYIAVRNKVDIGIGTSFSIPRASALCKMSSINQDDDDDEVEPAAVKYAHPFSDSRLVPAALIGHKKTPKAIFYAGTHELAYVHPNVFTPDPKVLSKAGINYGEKFFIMRFVAFKAYHDSEHGGITFEQKKSLVEMLKPYGRVIITSEQPIEKELEEYRLPVPPEDILSLMSYASMFLGDSQTMTSEAAILGVPALKCNTFAGRLSVPNMLEEKYGLCYSYQPCDFDKFYAHAKKLLETPDIKEVWAERRKKFLAESIDVSAFFTWFVENYPESDRIMRENPDYQYNFR